MIRRRRRHSTHTPPGQGVTNPHTHKTHPRTTHLRKPWNTATARSFLDLRFRVQSLVLTVDATHLGKPEKRATVRGLLGVLL